MLGRIFGVKRVGGARYCKTLHNGEGLGVSVAPNIVRVIKWDSAVLGCMWHTWGVGEGICKRDLVSKPEGKRLSGRTWRSWENNRKSVLHTYN